MATHGFYLAPVAPYALSVVQPQARAAGYSYYLTLVVWYTSSAMQPLAPASLRSQGSVLISSYYLLWTLLGYIAETGTM